MVMFLNNRIHIYTKPVKISNYFLRKCFKGISVSNILFASLMKVEFFFFFLTKSENIQTEDWVLSLAVVLQWEFFCNNPNAKL